MGVVALPLIWRSNSGGTVITAFCRPSELSTSVVAGIVMGTAELLVTVGIITTTVTVPEVDVWWKVRWFNTTATHGIVDCRRETCTQSRGADA
jgi:hypothetical protein